MAKKKATRAKILPLPALLTDFEVTCGNRPFAQITAKFINAARKAVSFKITRTELSLATLLQKKPGKITIKEKNSSFLPISTIRDFPNADTLAELKELTASINGDKIAVFPLAKETTIVEVKDGKASRYDFQDYTVSSFKIYRYTIKTKNKTVSKVVFCTYQKRKALCLAISQTRSDWNDMTSDDAYATKRAFEYNGIETDVLVDATKADIQTKIRTFFGDLGPNDIAIVWSASHGSEEGLRLDGPQHKLITYAEYRDLLNTVSCKKIALIFACHSGAAIESAKSISAGVTLPKRSKAEITRATKAINTQIKNVFFPAATKAKAGAMAVPGFSVVCSCKASENTAGNSTISPVAAKWCLGLGIICSNNGTEFTETSRYADLNENKKITVQELTDYTNTAEKENHSTAVCYPANDSTVIAIY